MSNFLSLLPLSLDAGAPRETDRAVVPKTPAPATLPIPEAWLAPPQAPMTRPKSAKAIYAALLALLFGLMAWDYFTPPAAEVPAKTQDSACPAP